MLIVLPLCVLGSRLGIVAHARVEGVAANLAIAASAAQLQSALHRQNDPLWL